MAARPVYWRLGLFLVLGVLCIVLTLGLFGSKVIGHKTVDYWTYFDEGVAGLDVGAPVRFRGIVIGRVGAVGLAPDRRHIEVTCSLWINTLRRLGLATQEGHEVRFALQPDMRAQLGQGGGLAAPKDVGIDYFDPATHPAPSLPFAVPARTIPSTPSTLGGLEQSLTAAVARLPEVAARASRLFGEGSDLVAQLGQAHLGERTGETLRGADDVLAILRRVLREVSSEQIPQQLGQALGTLDSALSQLDGLLVHLEGEDGLVTSARRATDAAGAALRGTSDVGRQVDATLQQVRLTAATIRRLADAIDRNPDMLVKGRPKAAP